MVDTTWSEIDLELEDKSSGSMYEWGTDVSVWGCGGVLVRVFMNVSVCVQVIRMKK